MIRSIEHFKFLVKSTNAHGVHSPFVFDYLTKGIYTRPRLSKNKVENILLKSIPYFEIKNAQIEDKGLQYKLESFNFKKTVPYDLVVFKTLSVNKLLKMISDGTVHNDTLFVVQHLQKQQSEWKKTYTHPKVKVSMDCFLLGILFIRKEQVKEHFTIRL